MIFKVTIGFGLFVLGCVFVAAIQMFWLEFREWREERILKLDKK